MSRAPGRKERWNGSNHVAVANELVTWRETSCPKVRETWGEGCSLALEGRAPGEGETGEMVNFQEFGMVFFLGSGITFPPPPSCARAAGR